MVDLAQGESGSWDGYGILLTGISQLPAAVALKKLHTKVVIETFGSESSWYESLMAGNVLFAKVFEIDQQPYLQGYMPVSILHTQSPPSTLSLIIW